MYRYITFCANPAHNLTFALPIYINLLSLISLHLKAAAAYCESIRVDSNGAVHFRVRSTDDTKWIASAADTAAEAAAAEGVGGSGLTYVDANVFDGAMFKGERGVGFTIAYNVGLLLEAMSQTTRAEALFKAVIEHQPSYAGECAARLLTVTSYFMRIQLTTLTRSPTI